MYSTMVRLWSGVALINHDAGDGGGKIVFDTVIRYRLQASGIPLREVEECRDAQVSVPLTRPQASCTSPTVCDTNSTDRDVACVTSAPHFDFAGVYPVQWQHPTRGGAERPLGQQKRGWCWGWMFHQRFTRPKCGTPSVSRVESEGASDSRTPTLTQHPRSILCCSASTAETASLPPYGTNGDEGRLQIDGEEDSIATTATATPMTWCSLMSSSSVQCLFVCGGDGTLRRVANTLQESYHSRSRVKVTPPPPLFGWQCSSMCSASSENLASSGKQESRMSRKTTTTITSGRDLCALGGNGNAHNQVKVTETENDHQEEPLNRCGKEDVGSGSWWWRKPIVLVPTGTRNSVASHLGVTSAERSLRSFAAGRTEKLWVWALTTHCGVSDDHERPPPHGYASPSPPREASLHETRTYFVSYLLLGWLAKEEVVWQSWRREWNEFVALPRLAARPTRGASVVCESCTTSYVPSSSYSSVVGHQLLRWWSHLYALQWWRPRRRLIYADLFLRIDGADVSRTTSGSGYDVRRQNNVEESIHGEVDDDDDEDRKGESMSFDRCGDHERGTSRCALLHSGHDDDIRERQSKGGWIRVAGPLQLLVVAALPSQGEMCWLTPSAEPRSRLLSVTVADATASSLRLWHLARREARSGHILEEDGVKIFERVTDVQIVFHPSSRYTENLRRTAKGGGGGEKRWSIANIWTPDRPHKKLSHTDNPPIFQQEDSDDLSLHWDKKHHLSDKSHRHFTIGLVDGDVVQFSPSECVHIHSTSNFLNVFSG